MTLDEIKTQITHWVEKWYPLVGDPRLDLEITWSPSPDRKSGCNVVEPYLVCDLEFSPTRIIAVYTDTTDGHVNLEAVEQEVIHECAHTIPWRAIQRLVEAGVSEKEAELYEEQITTQIDRAVWKAYQLGKDEGARARGIAGEWD
jgi:hypothetical protein